MDQRSSKPDDKNDFNIIQKVISSNMKMQEVGENPLQELKLKYNKGNVEDVRQLKQILTKYLNYPSSQVAQIHQKANRLGYLDIYNQFNQDSQSKQEQLKEDTKFCSCCGFAQQNQALPIITDLSNVTHIGISTYLYFFTIKALIAFLIVMMVIYSCYSIITNKVSSNIYESSLNGKKVQQTQLSYMGLLSFSLGSKKLYQSSYGYSTFTIQNWLGVSMIIIWAIIFIYVKIKERQAQYEVDNESKTASDYSLYIENMPKNMTQRQLQRQLRQYQQTIKQYFQSPYIEKEIQVVKINYAVPFYLSENYFESDQLTEVNNKYREAKEQIINLIKQREDSETFSKTHQERQQIYKRFKELKQKKKEIYKSMTDKIIQEKKKEHMHVNSVPAFVTFASSFNKEFLQKAHDSSSYKAFYKLPCFSGRRKFFHFEKDEEDGHDHKHWAIIEPAPQPEDILWTNLGQRTCQLLKKKFVTYMVTLILLCISFFAIYGLSNLQLNAKKGSKDSMLDTILGYVISMVISVTNIIVGKILSYLTKYERNETYIEEQTSIGMKAVFANIINSIFIPFFVNMSLKFNLYGVDGLADDVFSLAITTSFLTPCLKIFDFNFILARFWAWYYSRPYAKLYLNQKQLNTYHENLQFSIGYQYIHIVNLFLFTCFFVSIQPVIVVFSISGLFLLYWVQKFCLFNRYKRPVPGNNVINTAMYQLIFLGPMMYSFGTFCWSTLLSNSESGRLPNLVALIISGVIFILPYKKVIKCIVDQRPEPQLIFNYDRIFLPSEYDRLNPSTSDDGIKDYMRYLKQYKMFLKMKDQKQIQQINYIFSRQYGTGRQINRNLMGGNQAEDEQIIRQLLGNPEKNSVNPMIMGLNLLEGVANKERGPSINFAAQNWGNSEEVNFGGGGMNFEGGQTISFGNNNQDQTKGNIFTNLLDKDIHERNSSNWQNWNE